MRNWLTRFRLSAALDADKPLPPSLARAAARSEEARQFSDSLRRLDETLRVSVPREAVPPALHSSIMRAVRQADRTPVHAPLSRTIPSGLFWATAAALALVFSGVWWSHRAPSLDLSAPAKLPPAVALSAASDAVSLSENMVRTAPAATLAPLDDEWKRINRDIDASAKTLLASVP